MVVNLADRNTVGSLLISKLWNTQIQIDKLKFRENLRKVSHFFATKPSFWRAINLEL